MLEKMLAIIFSLMIFAQAAFVRHVVGTWIFPACIFGLFWFLYTIIPLVALFTIPISPYSVGYILLACLLFSTTALSFNWQLAFKYKRHRIKGENYNTIFIRRTFFSISAIVIISMFADILNQGFTMREIVFNLVITANSYIAKRYSDEIIPSIFGQLGVVLTYPMAIFGGLIIGSQSKKKKRIYIVLAAIIPSVLSMLIQGNKGTLFLVIALFWAGFLITKIERGETKLITKDGVKALIIFAALATPIIMISFISRGLYELESSSLIIEGLIRYIASYSSAHLYAFSDFFSSIIGNSSSNSYESDELAAGFFTFMSLFVLFGSSKTVPAGVYDEYFEYGSILKSNIYTMFRGLIQDFGMIGSLLFMVAIGLALHLSFWILLTKRFSYISVSIFTHSIGFFYTSFIISLLIWKSIYASIIIVWLILFVNSLIYKPTPTHSEFDQTNIQ